MNPQCHAVKVVLGRAAKEKAVSYVYSFKFTQEEEAVLLSEIFGKSVQQVAMEQHVSPETVKRWRCRALTKMAESLHL